MENKNKEFESWLKVEIPHIMTVVHFADLSKLQGVEHKGFAYTCVFGEPIEKSGKLEICIFIKDIEKIGEMDYHGTLAHEIVHAIQFICEELMFDFTEEKEHTAYIISYLIREFENKVNSTLTTK